MDGNVFSNSCRESKLEHAASVQAEAIATEEKKQTSIHKTTGNC